MLAPEWVEMSSGIHPFGPAILNWETLKWGTILITACPGRCWGENARPDGRRRLGSVRRSARRRRRRRLAASAGMRARATSVQGRSQAARHGRLQGLGLAHEGPPVDLQKATEPKATNPKGLHNLRPRRLCNPFGVGGIVATRYPGVRSATPGSGI